MARRSWRWAACCLSPSFAGRADASVLRLARRLAIAAALIGLAVLALRFGIRAARISGMGFEGATDPMMLGFVWESPLGTAAIWRGLGWVAILAHPDPPGRPMDCFGGQPRRCGFLRTGRAYSGSAEGRFGNLAGATPSGCRVLGRCACAVAPRGPLSPDGAGVLHHFGTVAAFAVAILILAGTALAYLLSGSLAALFGTAYGLGLLLKVAIVAALLGLAALNKVRLCSRTAR